MVDRLILRSLKSILIDAKCSDCQREAYGVFFFLAFHRPPNAATSDDYLELLVRLRVLQKQVSKSAGLWTAGQFFGHQYGPLVQFRRRLTYVQSVQVPPSPAAIGVQLVALGCLKIVKKRLTSTSWCTAFPFRS